MIKIMFGIALILWGACQIFAFIKYSYDERKRLYDEFYSNKEPKE